MQAQRDKDLNPSIQNPSPHLAHAHTHAHAHASTRKHKVRGPTSRYLRQFARYSARNSSTSSPDSWRMVGAHSSRSSGLHQPSHLFIYYFRGSVYETGRLHPQSAHSSRSSGLHQSQYFSGPISSLPLSDPPASINTSFVLGPFLWKWAITAIKKQASRQSARL